MLDFLQIVFVQKAVFDRKPYFFFDRGLNNVSCMGPMSEPRRATLVVVRRAFGKAGVEFINENGAGPTIRLQKPVRGKSVN